MCRYTGKSCEFATPNGYCTLTNCVKKSSSGGKIEYGETVFQSDQTS